MNLQVLENVFESYRDRVRFAYLYVREAHPIPDFAPCGPTSELGWNHPSADTRSMAERAQRARWLQDDLDLGFPYLIDFMDDRLKSRLRLGGFYVGWVADCTGEVVVHERWAWATPASQWCGLPLADVDDLTAVLDDLVASPGCSPPPEATREWIVPGVAHLRGIGDTGWSSDLVLANPGPEDVQVELRLLRDAIAKSTVEVALPGGASVTLADVVRTTFDTTGAGAVRVRSPGDVVVVGRTIADTDAGVFRQHLPAIPPGDAAHDLAPAHLLPVEQNADRRTNLQLVNLTSSRARVRVVASGPDEERLGERIFRMLPGEVRTSSRILEALGADDVAGARIEVHALTGRTRVLPIASVVDRSTGDAVLIPPRLVTFATDSVVVTGARTEWTGDVLLHNPLSTPVEATLEHRPLDPDRPVETTVVDIAPGSSRLRAATPGGSADGHVDGTLAVDADDGILMQSVGRSSSDRPVSGPALDVTGESVLRPGHVAHLIGLARSADGELSTSIIVQSLDDQPISAELTLLDSGGAVRSAVALQLSAGRAVRLDDALADAFPDGVADARAEIRLETRTARATAWAQSLDSSSGDAVLQVAAMLPEQGHAESAQRARPAADVTTDE